MATFVLRLTPQEIRNVSVDSAEPSQSVGDPGGVDRDPVPHPVAKARPPIADRRVLPRRREEGREADPDRRRRPGRGHLPDASYR